MPVYTCKFCCDFWCDFLLLMDVNEWISSEYSENMYPRLNIHNSFTRSHQSEEGNRTRSRRIASVNQAQERCLKAWAYGKEKIRGAERNLPDFFGFCPSCQKNFPEKLSKIVVDGGGRNDYEKFLLDSTFPTKLTEFPTKLTEFVPFIFIISQYCPTAVKRILPNWLCLPNKLGGGGGGCRPPPARYLPPMPERG